MEGQFRREADRASLELALLLLGALACSVWLGTALPLALVGPLALAILVLRLRAFGSRASALPNIVTALRVIATGLLALQASGLSPGARAGAVALVFALDGLDGYLARQKGASSLQGAHFDMEADGYLVLTVCSLHALTGLGAWVLIGGTLRYAYVIVTALFPSRGEAPRSCAGRYAFAASLSTLTLALLVPGQPAYALAGLGTAILSWSFGRSFVWSFRGT